MTSAIVTGCSRGIGRAVTEMLISDGWDVLGISRTRPDIKHEQFSWWWFDVGNTRDELVLGDRPFDALVHCAGIRGPFGLFLENDPEAWAQTIATNLTGTARIVRAALPALLRSEDARVLLFSGGGAFSPEPGYSAYAASKGGTVALMETLASELTGTSVAVNAVAPGFVATDIHKGTPHEGRKAEPDAMANAVACVRHLLSPQTRGLTGRTISATWDDWRNITSWTLPHLGEMGTRDRHLISGLERLMIRSRRAV